MADYTEEILALEQLLNSSASSVSVDGMSTSIDLEQARRRLQELRALDDASRANSRHRPTAATIRLNYF